MESQAALFFFCNLPYARFGVWRITPVLFELESQRDKVQISKSLIILARSIRITGGKFVSMKTGELFLLKSVTVAS